MTLAEFLRSSQWADIIAAGDWQMIERDPVAYVMGNVTQPWALLAWFREENKNNHTWDHVMINGDRSSVISTDFWRHAIVQKIRSALSRELLVEENASLVDYFTYHTGFGELDNVFVDIFENVSSNRATADIRSAIDRLVPANTSYPDLYVFVDHIMFYSNDLWRPLGLGALLMADVDVAAREPQVSAVSLYDVGPDLSIAGFNVDARSTSYAMAFDDTSAAVAISPTRSTGGRTYIDMKGNVKLHDMCAITQPMLRRVIFDRLPALYFKRDIPTKSPDIHGVLVSMYINPGNLDSHTLCRSFEVIDEGFGCSIGLALHAKPGTSFSGANHPGSLREEPWRLLLSNVVANADTQATTWAPDDISADLNVSITAVRDVCRHLLCERFVASSNLNIDTAYSTFYLPLRGAGNSAVSALMLSSTWYTLSTLFDTRAGEFERNVTRMLRSRKPAVGDIMKQICATDPVAYDRAIQLFRSGQAAYGGGRVGQTDSTLPMPPRYTELVSAAGHVAPSSTQRRARKYINDRQWLLGDTLRI